MTDLDVWGYELHEDARTKARELSELAQEEGRPARCRKAGCGHFLALHGPNGCAVIDCYCRHAEAPSGRFKSTLVGRLEPGGNPARDADSAPLARFNCSPREGLKFTPLPPSSGALAVAAADLGAELARETRRAARRRILGGLPNLRARVLAALAASPAGLTAEEVERVTGLSGNTVRPRLAELADLGRAVRSPRVRSTSSGRSAVVWTVAGEVTP